MAARPVLGLGLLTAGLALLALGVGEVPLFDPALDAATRMAIVIEGRLPRVLLALLIGAGLGLAGAGLQGLTRNPLAEPALVGASASAALGAVLAFYYGLAAVTVWALPVAGIAGAGLALVTMLLLLGPAMGSTAFILAGVAVNGLAAALTALALNLAPSPFALSEILFWLMGSFEARRLSDVVLAAPFIVGGMAMIARAGPGLAALTLGDEAAAGLGFDLARLRLQLLVGAALVTGAATAVAGAIGFVGLIAPHVLRPWAAGRPDRLLWLAALGGAALLLAADIAVRLLPGQVELRLGVVTALIAAPFFFRLIRQTGARDA